MSSNGANSHESLTRAYDLREMSFQNVVDRILKPSGIKMGGFPEEMFFDLSESDQQTFMCNICYLIANDIRQCDNKHIFCHSCILAWSMTYGENSQKCPLCRCDQSEYHPDKELESQLEDKRVRCLAEGCSFKAPLRIFLMHSHGKSTYSNAEVDFARLRAEQPRIFALPTFVELDIDESLPRAVTIREQLLQGRMMIHQMMLLMHLEMQLRQQALTSYQEAHDPTQRLQRLDDVMALNEQLNEVGSILSTLLSNPLAQGTAVSGQGIGRGLSLDTPTSPSSPVGRGRARPTVSSQSNAGSFGMGRGRGLPGSFAPSRDRDDVSLPGLGRFVIDSDDSDMDDEVGLLSARTSASETSGGLTDEDSDVLQDVYDSYVVLHENRSANGTRNGVSTNRFGNLDSIQESRAEANSPSLLHSGTSTFTTGALPVARSLSRQGTLLNRRQFSTPALSSSPLSSSMPVHVSLNVLRSSDERHVLAHHQSTALPNILSSPGTAQNVSSSTSAAPVPQSSTESRHLSSDVHANVCVDNPQVQARSTDSSSQTSGNNSVLGGPVIEPWSVTETSSSSFSAPRLNVPYRTPNSRLTRVAQTGDRDAARPTALNSLNPSRNVHIQPRNVSSLQRTVSNSSATRLVVPPRTIARQSSHCLPPSPATRSGAATVISGFRTPTSRAQMVPMPHPPLRGRAGSQTDNSTASGEGTRTSHILRPRRRSEIMRDLLFPSQRSSEQ